LSESYRSVAKTMSVDYLSFTYRRTISTCVLKLPSRMHINMVSSEGLVTYEIITQDLCSRLNYLKRNIVVLHDD